jgi:hypothetical protein
MGILTSTTAIECRLVATGLEFSRASDGGSDSMVLGAEGEATTFLTSLNV